MGITIGSGIHIGGGITFSESAGPGGGGGGGGNTITLPGDLMTGSDVIDLLTTTADNIDLQT